MEPMRFAVAALVTMASMPATAAIVSATFDTAALVPFQFNVVDIDPVSLDVGDELDVTINFTNGPMVVGNNSRLWIGLVANDAGASMDVTSTLFVLGGSANMVGSVDLNQINEFGHVGNAFAAPLVRTGPGNMSFSGLRQLLTINSSDPDGPRRYRKAFFSFNALPAGGIPEPHSWAMLIAGFGLVGATARRRRLRTT